MKLTIDENTMIFSKVHTPIILKDLVGTTVEIIQCGGGLTFKVHGNENEQWILDQHTKTLIKVKKVIQKIN